MIEAGPRLAIGVDVGGSGIKTAVVDVDSGLLASERLRVPTPTPSTPEAVIASIGRLVKRLVEGHAARRRRSRSASALPGVAIGGMIKTAANIDAGWVDFPVVERLGQASSAVRSPSSTTRTPPGSPRCASGWARTSPGS